MFTFGEMHDCIPVVSPGLSADELTVSALAVQLAAVQAELLRFDLAGHTDQRAGCSGESQAMVITENFT